MSPELVHQHPLRHELDVAGFEIADLKGPEGKPDQTVDAQSELGEHALHFAVLAFLQAERQPDIRPLNLVDDGLDRAVAHTFDGDAVLQLVEVCLCDAAPCAHAVAPRPAGGRKFEQPGEFTVIREKQKPLGVDVEAAHGNDAGNVVRQFLENGRPALGVLRRGYEPGGLVIAPEPRRLLRRQRLAVHDDGLAAGDIEGRAFQHLAIHRDAALLDELFRLAARADARPRDDFRDAVACRGA